MKIRYLHHFAGAIDRAIGEVADVDVAEAKRLIAAGFAEPIKADPPARRSVVETAAASKAKVERAAGRRPRKSKPEADQ